VTAQSTNSAINKQRNQQTAQSTRGHDIEGAPQMVLHFFGKHAKASPRHPVAKQARETARGIWHCATPERP